MKRLCICALLCWTSLLSATDDTSNGHLVAKTAIRTLDTALKDGCKDLEASLRRSGAEAGPADALTEADETISPSQDLALVPITTVPSEASPPTSTPSPLTILDLPPEILHHIFKFIPRNRMPSCFDLDRMAKLKLVCTYFRDCLNSMPWKCHDLPHPKVITWFPSTQFSSFVCGPIEWEYLVRQISQEKIPSTAIHRLTLKTIPGQTFEGVPGSLHTLHIEQCYELASLKGLPQNLHTLTLQALPELQSIEGLPENLKRLQLVSLDRSQIIDLPKSLELERLPNALKHLRLESSPELFAIENLPPELETLEIDDVPCCNTLAMIPHTLTSLKLRNLPRLESLAGLPSTLIDLKLHFLNIKTLEGLPSSLKFLEVRRMDKLNISEEMTNIPKKCRLDT
eukprot:g8376.t1